MGSTARPLPWKWGAAAGPAAAKLRGPIPGTMPRLVFHHRPAEASLLLSPEPGPDVPRPDSLVPDTSPQPVSS